MGSAPLWLPPRTHQRTENGDAHLPRPAGVVLRLRVTKGHVKSLSVQPGGRGGSTAPGRLRRRVPPLLLRPGAGPRLADPALARLCQLPRSAGHVSNWRKRLTEAGGRDRSRYVENRRRTRVVAGCRNR